VESQSDFMLVQPADIADRDRRAARGKSGFPFAF